MGHLRNQKGQGVSEIARLEAEEASEREWLHMKGINGLNASKVQEAWRKSMPVEQGHTGSEPKGFCASERQEVMQKSA